MILEMTADERGTTIDHQRRTPVHATCDYRVTMLDGGRG